MDKAVVITRIYAYGGLLFSHEERRNSAICNTDLEGIMLSGISQTLHVPYVKSKKKGKGQTLRKMVSRFGGWGKHRR